MPLSPIKTQSFGGEVTADHLRRLQTAVDQATRPLFACPLVDGQLLEGIEIGAAVSVGHGLGRPLKGWILTRISAQADVWDHQATNTTPEKTLALEVSAPCTISVWVF